MQEAQSDGLYYILFFLEWSLPNIVSPHPPMYPKSHVVVVVVVVVVAVVVVVVVKLYLFRVTHFNIIQLLVSHETSIVT